MLWKIGKKSKVKKSKLPLEPENRNSIDIIDFDEPQNMNNQLNLTQNDNNGVNLPQNMNNQVNLAQNDNFGVVNNNGYNFITHQ